MGIATFLIGFLPPAQGNFVVLAPLMLVLLRFAQGLALGGEWSGAALLATENAPANKRAIYGTFPQLGAPIGFIIANVIFVVLQTTLTDGAVHGLGLARAVRALGRHGRRGPLGPPEARRIRLLPEGRRPEEGRQVAVQGHHEVPLAPGGCRHVHHARHLRALLPHDLLHADLRHRAGHLEAARAAAEAKGKVFDAPPRPHSCRAWASPVTEFLTMLIIGVVFFGIFTVVSGPLAEKFGRRKFLIAVTVGHPGVRASLDPDVRPGQGRAPWPA